MTEIEHKLFLGKVIQFASIGGGCAVHFWVAPDWNDRNRSFGGLEYHRPPKDGEVRDYGNCRLLNGPCCHDGNSLEADPLIRWFYDGAPDGNYERIWSSLDHFLQEMLTTE